MKKIKFPSTDRIIGLSAMLLSLCTLIVFLYQTNLIRKQQYMSVYPYLQLYHNGAGTADYSLTITNKGIGPAIIDSISVGKNGVIKDQGFLDFFIKEVGKDEDVQIAASNIGRGTLISAKEVMELLKSQDSLMASSNRLFDIFNNDSLKYEVMYSSIYGEKWRITDKSDIPEKLD